MARHAFNLAAAGSLLVLVAVLAAWVGSHRDQALPAYPKRPLAVYCFYGQLIVMSGSAPTTAGRWAG